MLPTPHEPLWLRLEDQNLHIPAAEFLPLKRPPASPLCSPLPANPYASVPGSKIFTLPPPVFTLPRGRRPPLFAPHSPRALVTPFRGAKSSHSRRRISPSQATGSFLSLLPAPREPCDSVSGSKIFTFPPPDFSLSSDRQLPLFAPRSPRALVAPSRGAKSSHSRRRISPSQATGGLLSLLPTPREPLWLRFGEQNLHIPAAGFRPLRRPTASSLCSPRALVAPFRGAKSSHSRRRFPPSPTAGVPQQQKTSGPRLIRSPGCSAATHFSILHFQRPKVEPP